MGSAPRSLAPSPRASRSRSTCSSTRRGRPGRYVLRFDLVEEHRFWLSEVGVETHDVEVDVAPLIASRRLAVVVHGGPDPRTEAALAAQEEAVVGDEPSATAHLVAGAEPAPGWSRLLLDAHAEGWAAVGPALVPEGGPFERRRAARALRRWAPGGRNPRFDSALLLPSLVEGLELGEHRGLPAFDGGGPLRGSGDRQASDAIRSSTDLKTSAPSASAATAATQRYKVFAADGSSPA